MALKLLATHIIHTRSHSHVSHHQLKTGHDETALFSSAQRETKNSRLHPHTSLKTVIPLIYSLQQHTACKIVRLQNNKGFCLSNSKTPQHGIGLVCCACYFHHHTVYCRGTEEQIQFFFSGSTLSTLFWITFMGVIYFAHCENFFHDNRMRCCLCAKQTTMERTGPKNVLNHALTIWISAFGQYLV